MENIKKPQLAILFLLVSFPSFGAVLFTPALPSIISFFQISTSHSSLAISVYLIGYAFGQLPYGPLANRLGRKPTLYIGICIAIVGCLLCALSSYFSSFGLLVFARFVQALGACVGLKISFTMVADAYEPVDATRMIARLGMAFAVMPAIGVTIGGYLTRFFSWESCFYFLALFGCVVLWLSMRLPETGRGIDRDALKFFRIVNGYASLLKNKYVVMSGLMMGCGTSIIYIFNAKAPFLGIQHIGLDPNVFGIYSMIPLLGMLLGAFLADRLAGRFSLVAFLLVGLIISLSGSFLMLLYFANGSISSPTLFSPMFLIYMIDSIVFANVMSFGLSKAENKANGSAMLNFISLSLAVLAVSLVGGSSSSSELLMPLSFVALLFIVFLLCFGLRRSSEV